MKKTIFKTALAALIVSAPIAVYAGSLTGDCVTCHTMHNSELGSPVAEISDGAGSVSITGDAIPNLLRADCIACHAQATGNNLESGIPQVYHLGDELAAGNFAYIDGIAGSGANNRKGHNVIDLLTADTDNFDANGAPPGAVYSTNHGDYFGVDGSRYENFTCAGTVGCHGTRAQIVSDTDIGNDNELAITRRVGMLAINGAHHSNTDGAKTSAGYTAAGEHDGAVVAAGYRFIPGLQGYENEGTRWTNASATDHNEYYGDATTISLAGCTACHIDGLNYAAEGGTDSKMTTDSTLAVPNNSMSGFCSTCHGEFHSAGTANGSSGAFLRHPSDYILDVNVNADYGAYTLYDLSAPVARGTVSTSASGVVTGSGTDMVMCLSCHQAHATDYAYMLRFDYSAQAAGAGTASGGCVACHSSKGAL